MTPESLKFIHHTSTHPFPLQQQTTSLPKTHPPFYRTPLYRTPFFRTPLYRTPRPEEPSGYSRGSFHSDVTSRTHASHGNHRKTKSGSLVLSEGREIAAWRHLVFPATLLGSSHGNNTETKRGGWGGVGWGRVGEVGNEGVGRRFWRRFGRVEAV